MSAQCWVTNAATTGLLGTEANFLDLHFEACRTEYEAMLRSVGIRPDWHVLDAGCGGGSFLPVLAELVGPHGRLTAYDLAPDSIASVEARIRQSGFGCSAEARVGDLTALPYPPATFDAVWCANALMYLSDVEMATALSEFRRVLRPGGLVAIKDIDLGLTVLAPAAPEVMWHLLEFSRSVVPTMHGCLRARDLRRWLAQAGFVDVWQRATLIELGPPLQPMQRAYIGSQLAQLGGVAARSGVPEADLVFWQAQRDPGAPGTLAQHADLYWSEGHFVAVGTVPERTA